MQIKLNVSEVEKIWEGASTQEKEQWHNRSTFSSKEFIVGIIFKDMNYARKQAYWKIIEEEILVRLLTAYQKDGGSLFVTQGDKE